MSLDRRQLLALFATLLIAALALATAGIVLLPFIVALLLALLLHPLYRRLRATGLSPGAAAALGTTSATLITLALAFGGVPILAQDVQELGSTVVENASELLERLKQLWGHWLPSLQPLEQTLEEKAGDLAPSMETIVPAISSVLNVGGVLASTVILALLVPVVLFFFLKQGRGFREAVVGLVPRRYQAAARDLMLSVGDGLGDYLRGQALVCATQAAYHATGLMLIGLQFGLLIGVLTGLSALIPIVGNAVMLSVAFLVAIAQFDELWPTLAVLALYGSAQILETLILVPVLVGKQIRVHPLLMLTAALLGGRLFGFVGALLALPATTVVVTTARWLWARYERSDVYVAVPGGRGEDAERRDAA